MRETGERGPDSSLPPVGVLARGRDRVGVEADRHFGALR